MIPDTNHYNTKEWTEEGVTGRPAGMRVEGGSEEGGWSGRRRREAGRERKEIRGCRRSIVLISLATNATLP